MRKILYIAAALIVAVAATSSNAQTYVCHPFKCQN